MGGSGQEPGGGDAGGDGGSGRPALDLRICAAGVVVGLAAGALAVAFRWLLHGAQAAHDEVVRTLGPIPLWGWPAVLAVFAPLGGFAAWLVYRFAPEAAGSGIPVVEARLRDEAPLRWRRILPVKMLGGLAALATGMSLGREGPIVHLGASAAEAVADSVGARGRSRRTLVAAGAGAGLAGAFDAPLAGFVFVIEELRWEFTPLTTVVGLVAAACTQLVVRAAFGPEPIFDVGVVDPVPFWSLALVAVLGVFCGLVGVLYNRSIRLALDLFDRWRGVPRWVHGAAAAAFAGLIAAWFRPALFGGDPLAGAIVRGQFAELAAGVPRGDDLGHLIGLSPIVLLSLLIVVKLVLTAVSYGSNVVGGLFAPQLVIGAALGALVGEIAAPFTPGVDLAPALAAAGMVGVFTASVRAPVTGVLLLLEMTGSVARCLPFVIAAAVAYLVATLLRDPPIYEALGQRAVRAKADQARADSAAPTATPAPSADG